MNNLANSSENLNGPNSQYSVFAKDALRAWKAYQQDGLHLTFEEVDTWLAKLAAGADSELPSSHV